MRKLEKLDKKGMVSLYLRVNAKQVEKLNQMLESGLWGTSVNQVILRIVDIKLNEISQP